MYFILRLLIKLVSSLSTRTQEESLVGFEPTSTFPGDTEPLVRGGPWSILLSLSHEFTSRCRCHLATGTCAEPDSEGNGCVIR